MQVRQADSRYGKLPCLFLLSACRASLMSPDRLCHKRVLCSIIFDQIEMKYSIDVRQCTLFLSFRRAGRAAEPAARGPGGLAQRGPLLGSAAQDAPSPGHQLQDLHQVSQSVSQSTTHHLTVGDKNAAATSAGEVGEVFPSSLSASASPPSACAIAAPPKFLFLYPLRSPFLPSILSRPLDGQAY